MDRLMQELEQVIRHLDKDYVLLPIDTAKQIAALLRAGAEMRYDADLSCEHMTEAAKAWDAALNEGEEHGQIRRDY